MRISFFAQGTPVPQGALRSARGRMFYPNNDRLMAWRKTIGLLANAFFKEPVEGPIEIDVVFYQNLPTRRPDVDKLARAVLDALTGIVYHDDSQVVRLNAIKRLRGRQDNSSVLPGAAITITIPGGNDDG